MQEKLQQADTDGNGALSKSELTDATEGAGRLQGNLDRMFTKLDSDGNGELSKEEQAKMQEQMQERMVQFQSMGSSISNTGYQQTNSFQSLLDSLDSNDEDDQELKQAIEQAQQKNGEGRQEALQTINDRLAPIDTFA